MSSHIKSCETKERKVRAFKAILEKLDLVGEQDGAGTGVWAGGGARLLESVSPIDGGLIGRVRMAEKADHEKVVRKAAEAFRSWQMVPAPKRGEIVRQLGNALREEKKPLGALVSLEMGKIRQEGEGEVQEMIDISDFAVGQSRMLYGRTMHSERAKHRMYEQYHPLGPVGVITSFNFPVAVWAWNAMIALVAGDPVIWKPSSKTPLCAVAVQKIAWRVLRENGLPEGILNLLIGSRHEVGEPLIRDPRVPLISATGSVPMGNHVGQVVASRFGRSILELSGNNGVIVTPSADLDLTLRAILFGAVGTAGQRCTTIRRALVHQDIFDRVCERFARAYKQVRIGDPLEPATLMGPLVDADAVTKMQDALQTLKAQGGKVLYGGEVLSGGLFDTGTYVKPCLCEARPDMEILTQETFAPILYLIRYASLEEAIANHNRVSQGLSSAIFTNDLKEAEAFLSHEGSDCGIANVNIGTSGAEIGGAFGGEKETGGGREAGSDAWKAYMRRQTCTINWSGDLPLAQGVKFEI
jgi:aldehyde dehydrogenase (NAD+)